jgi:homoserine kinase
MKRIAMDSGVLSFGISGSGPSVVAISKGFDAAQLAVDRIQEHLTANGIESLQFVSAVNAEGPKVLS